MVIKITVQFWLLETGMQAVGIQLAGDNQSRLAFGSGGLGAHRGCQQTQGIGLTEASPVNLTTAVTLVTCCCHYNK